MGVDRIAGRCLLVDMGNQRLKWRIFPESGPLLWEQVYVEGVICIPQPGGIAGSGDPGQGGFASGLDEAFGAMEAPARVLLSAVSHGHAAGEFVRWCHTRWRITVEIIESPERHGRLVNGYEKPSQLGCDRWLAALASHWRVCVEDAQEAVIVVDAGTAVTVDLVTQDRFVGGAILPGMATIVRVLGRDTGRIRLDPDWFRERLSVDSDDVMAVEVPVAATNSNAAVHAGAFHAVCGGIERCIDGLMAIAGGMVRILVSGGDAGLVGRGVRQQVEFRGNLVLDGLALMAAGVSA